MVTQLQADHGIRKLCKVLGVSKSAYYAYVGGRSHALSSAKAIVSQAVEQVFSDHRRRYGWRRIQVELADQGLVAGRYQIRSRMKAKGLVAIQPKSFVPKTTQSNPALRRSPNLLLEAANWPSAPDQVVVGDITYLPNQETGAGKWLYLAVWLDLFSRRIVGWQLDRTMESSLVIEAFRQVIRTRHPKAGLIVHSDGGGQYASADFRSLLSMNAYRQSMTRKDNHYDNAHAESLFSRFKAELLNGGVFYGLEDAHERVFEYIEGYYNQVRRHSAIGYLSPAAFEQQYADSIAE